MNIDFSLCYEDMDKKLNQYKKGVITDFVEKQANEKKKEIDHLPELDVTQWKQRLGQIRQQKRKTYDELEAINPRIDFQALAKEQKAK